MTDGEGNVTEFDYSVANQTSITLGNRTYTIEFDQQKRLTSKTAVVDGQQVSTRYRYDNAGNIDRVTDGLGNHIHYGYDEAGNQIWQQDAAGRRIERTFNSDNKQLTETVFLNIDNDGVDGPNKASGEQTRYFVYDSNNRLRFTVSADGEVRQLAYNVLGQLEQSRVYVNDDYDVAQHSATSTPTIAQLNTWLNGLGSFAEYDVQLTKYDYDHRGNVDQQTIYQKVDAQGNGVNGTTTQFTYDLNGRLLQQTDAKYFSNTTYDGLGRVLTNEQGEVAGDSRVFSTSVYDDANQQIVISTANDLVTTRTYDDAGRLLTFEQGKVADTDQFNSEKRYYDAENREIARRHANGAISYQFYDDAGRLAYQVDRAGSVIAHSYDSASRLVESVHYSDLVATASWLVNDQLTRAASGEYIAVNKIKEALVNNSSRSNQQDRSERLFYDDAGVLRFKQDAAGYVTEYRYDGAGRQTHTIRYAELDAVSFNSSGAATIKQDAEFRVSRQFYDDAGKLLASMDEEGYVRQFHYDSAGQKTAEYQWAEAAKVQAGQDISAQQLRDADWSTLLLNQNAKDRVSHYRFNGKGERILTVSADGKVTKYEYDSEGKLDNMVEYARRLTGLSLGQTITLPTEDANDVSTDYSYNDFGLLETQVRQIKGDSQKLRALTTTYHYDKNNNLIGTVESDSQSQDVRNTLIGRDELGRDIGQLDPSEAAAIAAVTEQNIATALVNDGTERKYDAAGRLVSSKDSEGNTSYFYYDRRDLLTATINADGRVQTFKYNAFGELKQTTSYRALAVNALSTLTGGNESDIQALVTSLQSKVTNVTTNTYTKRGLLDITTTASTQTIDNDYNAFGQLKQVTTQLSAQSSRVDAYQYDDRGLLVKTIVDDGGINALQTTEFDAFGRVVSQTDALGNVTSSSYDDAAGQVITSYQTANGVVTETAQYDVFGRTVKMIDGAGRETTHRHLTESGQLVHYIYHDDDEATKLIYNAHGELTDRIRGKYTGNTLTEINAHTHYEHNKDGLVLRETQGYGSANTLVTEYVYNDNEQRIQTIVDPDGIAATTTYRYDASGQVISVKDAKNLVTRNVYDGEGNLVYTLDKSDVLKQYAYNANGKVTKTTTYYNAQTTSLNALLSQSGASKETAVLSVDLLDQWQKGTSFSSYSVYDKSGRTVLTIDATGAVTENIYNTQNLVVEKISYATLVSLSSDLQTKLAQGSLSQAELAQLRPVKNQAHDLITAAVYDSNGQVRFSLNKQADGQAIVKESQYDQAGRLVFTRTFGNTITYANDHSLSSGSQLSSWVSTQEHEPSNRNNWLFYDGSGKPRFNVDSLGGVTESQYNDVGQLFKSNSYIKPLTDVAALKDAFANGILSLSLLETHLTNTSLDSEDRSTQTFYDGAGRVKTVIDAEGHQQQWQYYDNGLKKSYTDKRGETWQYFYDDAGRLSRELGPLTANVQVANQDKTSYSTISGYLTTDFEYDDLGNVLKRHKGYVDSSASQLQTAQLASKITATFSYDKMGRQSSVSEVSVDSNSQQSPKTDVYTVYNAQGKAVVNRTDVSDSGAVTKQVYQYHVYDEVGRLAYQVDANGYVTGYSYDALGNQTRVSRYENKLVIAGHDADTEITLTQIKAANLGSARTITNEYNALGQKIRVIEPAVQYADAGQNGVITLRNGSPETQFKYNRFGEVIEQKVKINQNDWAVTRNYYDRLGQQRFSISAQGYVTQWQYNALGDVASKTEYANKTDHVSLTFAPNASSSDKDRVWEYQYDNLGRKTHETQKRVHVSQVNGSSFNGTPQVRDVTTETEYDAAGNVIEVDKDGYSIYNEYDEYGRVKQTYDNATQTVTNVEALQSSITTSATQLLTEFRYDSYGNVVKTLQGKLLNTVQRGNYVNESAAETRISQQFYNDKQQLIKSIDAVGAEKAFHYDFAGNLLKQVDSFAEQALNYTYNAQAVYTEDADNGFYGPRQQTVSLPSWLTLDKENGKLVGTAKVKDEFTAQIEVRNASGSLLKTYKKLISVNTGAVVNISLENWTYSPVSTQDQYAETKFVYDDVGQQTKVQRIRTRDGKSTVEAQQETQYNSYGEVIFQGDSSHQPFTPTVQQPLQVYFQYNNAGQLVRSNVNDGADKDFVYDLQGNLVKQSHVTKGDTVSIYDSQGRVTKQYQAKFSQDGIELKPSMSQELDRWGNIVRAVDTRGYATTYEYDHNNKLIREQRPLTKVVDADGSARFLRPTFTHYYDSQGRIVATKDANAHAQGSNEYQFFAYASNGLKLSETDQLGFTTEYGYNLFGEQIAKKDAEDYITVKKYDKVGQVTETGDIRLNDNSVFEYQRLNRYVYDDLGNRTILENALGYQFYYRYDTQGNILQASSPNGVSMSYTYDGRGNRTLESYTGIASQNNNSDNKVSHFDYFSNLRSKNDLDGNTTSYEVIDGQLRYKRFDLHDDGKVEQVVTYDYYDNGLLKSIHHSDTDALTKFKYNKAGLAIEQVRTTQNALGEKRTETTQTSYDSNGRVDQVIVREGEGDAKKVVSAILYTYDAMGNRRSMQVVNGYTGNVSAEVNTAPVFNESYGGISYHPASRNIPYHYDLGVASNIFFDAQGSELAYEIIATPGHPLPSWISLDSSALQQDPARLVFTTKGNAFGGKVPLSALEDTRFSIRAYEVDGPKENFTILPIHLPVKNDLAPRFKSQQGFGDLPPVSNEKAYQLELDLNKYIEDHENERLTYSIKWSENYSQAEIQQLESWFTLDSTNIANAKLTFSKQQDVKIPDYWLGKTLDFVVVASDSLVGGIQSENFYLQIDVEKFVYKLPTTLNLKQGIDTINLLDYLSGNATGIRFEITESGGGNNVVQTSGSANNLLNVNSGLIVQQPNRSLTISIFGSDNKRLAQHQTTLAIDARPQPPVNFNGIVFNRSGSGTFELPAFTDVNNNSLFYSFSTWPFAGGARFSIQSYNPSTDTYTVSYTGVDSLLSSGSGSLTVTVRQNNESRLSNSKTVSFSFPPPPNSRPEGERISSQSGVVGLAFTPTFAFWDPDRDQLYATVEGAPDGLSPSFEFNHSRGIYELKFVGTPKTAQSTRTKVTVTDGDLSIVREFDFTIQSNNKPPEVPYIGTQNGAVGLQFSSPTFDVKDPNSDSLSISVTGLPQGVSKSFVFNSSRSVYELKFIGKPEVAQSTRTKVTVTDGDLSTVREFDFTIAPNNEPTATVKQDLTLFAGNSKTITIYPEDIDNDQVTIESISVTEGWMEPRVAANQVVLSPGVGVRPGSYTFTVYLHDGRVTSSVSKTFTVQVNKPHNNPPTGDYIGKQEAIVNTSYSKVVYFEDKDFDDLTVKDFDLPEGIRISSFQRVFEYDPNFGPLRTHKYKLVLSGPATRVGSKFSTITVEDTKGDSVTKTFNFTVKEPKNVAPVAKQPSFSVTVPPGATWPINLDDHFTDQNDGSDKLVYYFETAEHPLVRIENNKLIIKNESAVNQFTKETIIAEDPKGLTAKMEFKITIEGSPDGEVNLRAFSTPEPLTLNKELSAEPLDSRSASNLAFSAPSVAAKQSSAPVYDKILEGGDRDDSFNYNLGDGRVLIRDSGGIHDNIVFGAGITPDNISISGDDQQYTFTFSDGGSLTVENWFDQWGNIINNVHFSDGTRWSIYALNGQLRLGTAQDDNFDFSSSPITVSFKGGLGDDVMKGSIRGDKYYYNLGDGNDVISDPGGNDEFIFGQGITPDNITVTGTDKELVVTFSDGGSITFKDWYKEGTIQLERLTFADGTIWGKEELGKRLELGTSGNDVYDFSDAKGSLGFKGGKGDDVFISGKYHDVYHYNLGDGKDVIKGTAGADRIIFGDGIVIGEFSITGDQSQIVFNFKDGGSITVDGWFNGDEQVERFEFADGTKWNIAELGRHLELGTDGDDNFDYSDASIHLGFRGGKGDDVLRGGTGEDTFYYDLGDGHDVISEAGGYLDKIVLGSGITPDNITISATDRDFTFTFEDGGTLTVDNWRDFRGNMIDIVEFADGTKWNRHELNLNLKIGTDADDSYDFSDTNYTLSHQGGLGDDVIKGGSGTDKYHYNLGDGHDVISDAGGYQDTIVFGDGITADNLTISGTTQQYVFTVSDGGTLTVDNWFDGTGNVIDYVEFSDGTRWNIYTLNSKLNLGTDKDDNFDFSNSPINIGFKGGLGDDVIKGTIRSDRYYYSLGDGNDVIADAGGYEILTFEGISSSDVVFYQRNGDMLVHVKSSDHVLTIKDVNGVGAMEKYIFSDLELSAYDVSLKLQPLPDNFAPGHRAIDNYRTDQGKPISLDLAPYFSDADGDDLSYSISSLPQGLTLSGTTLSGAVTTPGAYTIDVVVSDGVASNTESFTLIIDETNVAPTYTGTTEVQVQAGEFIRTSVAFTDVNQGDKVTTTISNLPQWLSFDPSTQEVYGFAPLGAGNSSVVLQLTGTDSFGAQTPVQLKLNISEPYQATTRYVQFQSQRINFGESLNHDVSAQFAALGSKLTYQLEVQQNNGGYQVASDDYWLSLSQGVLTGTSALKDVTSGTKLRITATNDKGDVALGELSIQVTGPAAKDVGKIEQTNDQVFSINAKDYFSGLSDSARYGLVVTAPASPQASSAQSAFASDAPQPSAFSSRSFSLASDEPEARSASNTPSIIIPSEYADWLSFDEQTGLLSGKPPQGLIDQLVFSFIAQQGDDINLSSNGILDIGDKAQTQEFWFDYDAKGQVTVDGGTLSQGVISIAQQGQYFEYDGMGRTTLSISDGGYTAQKMNYSAQGYLLSATHSYNNNKASGQDLFALRQTGNNLGSIHFANQVQHSYDLLGQVTSTLEYFTPGYSKNIDYTSSESGLAGTAKFDLTGIEKSKQEFAYNGDGQMTVSKEYGWAGESLQQELEKFAADKLYGGVTVEVSQFNNADLMPLVRDKLSTEHQLLSTVDNTFDKAGLLDLKIYTQHRKGENSGNSPAQFRHTYDYSYEGRDSYLEKRVVGTGSAQEGSFNPATTTSFYDFSGNRIAVEEKAENSSKYDARYFDYSADGKLLKKQSGTQNETHAGKYPTAPSVPVDGEGNPISDTVVAPSIAHTIGYEETKVPVIEQGQKVGDISTASHYMYAGGQYLGELTEHGQIRVKQQHFKGLDVIKSDSNRVHEVQEGETLRSIAQLQYGNGNFWFIIADANSLTSDPDEGLTVGQSLTIPQQNNNQNSFDTLLPMNLAELIGDTTPSLGYLPPPSEAGCNAVASIIMIAVAVAVSAGAGGALIGSSSSLFASGSSLTALGAATAAAAGSVASQVAGMALGEVDNFSWKQVAISAITAGATKGLGDKLKLDQIGANVAHDIARGAISYGAGHAANKLLGQQTSFSWSNLAASSLGYAAGAQVGTTLAQEIGVDFSTDFGSQLTSELTSGVADLHIGRALGENTKVDYGQIGLDAFGNAIGNTIAGRMERARQLELQERQVLANSQARGMSEKIQSNAAQDLNNSIAGTARRIAGDANTQLDERYTTNFNPNNGDDGFTPFFQSEAGANFLNRSTTLTQTLQDDVRVKADTLNQQQQRNLQTQQWVNRNTNEQGRTQQGFDLASLIADTTDFTDMSQPLTAGPWAEGYVFGETSNGTTVTEDLVADTSTLNGITNLAASAIGNSNTLTQYTDDILRTVGAIPAAIVNPSFTTTVSPSSAAQVGGFAADLAKKTAGIGLLFTIGQAANDIGSELRNEGNSDGLQFSTATYHGSKIILEVGIIALGAVSAPLALGAGAAYFAGNYFFDNGDNSPVKNFFRETFD